MRKVLAVKSFRSTNQNHLKNQKLNGFSDFSSSYICSLHRALSGGHKRSLKLSTGGALLIFKALKLYFRFWYWKAMVRQAVWSMDDRLRQKICRV